MKFGIRKKKKIERMYSINYQQVKFVMNNLNSLLNGSGENSSKIYNFCCLDL